MAIGYPGRQMMFLGTAEALRALGTRWATTATCWQLVLHGISTSRCARQAPGETTIGSHCGVPHLHPHPTHALTHSPQPSLPSLPRAPLRPTTLPRPHERRNSIRPRLQADLRGRDRPPMHSRTRPYACTQGVSSETQLVRWSKRPRYQNLQPPIGKRGCDDTDAEHGCVCPLRPTRPPRPLTSPPSLRRRGRRTC